MSSSLCRVLIADDEFWVRENLKNLLNWEDLSIELTEPAVDGEDALLKLESERPDILITDINMPFLNGNELIKIVRERYPHVPVIVLSGYSDFNFVREALLFGAVDYLIKPVTKNGLLDVLDKTLARWSSNKVQEQEQNELREKLLQATSLFRDVEMSALIAEDPPPLRTDRAGSELELDFAVFTLLLIKLTDPTHDRGRSPEQRLQLSYTVKNQLTQKAKEGKVTVFHNIYARNEYIVLTDLDATGIENLYSELPERLEKHTGQKVSVGVSRSYYSFDRLHTAYKEAVSALLGREITNRGSVSRAEDVQKIVVHKRISPEQENLLQFAIQSKNKELAREIVFDQIGLRNCERTPWLLIEVKQTVEYIAGMLFHHSDADRSTHTTLAVENFTDFLGMALESFEIAEVHSLLEQLIDEVLDNFEDSLASQSTKQSVRRIQTYIDENYFEDLSLTSLSKVFRIDRSYLSKIFKQVTGINLMLAIANKRMEKAAELIRSRDLSLSEVSYLVGYEEYAYFNRVFRKVLGVSPSEYKTAFKTEVRA